MIAGFGSVALTTALVLPGSAGAQAVVNTVKLGACDDLLGVCLANPTQRYKHGVFGQPFEYGTILTIDENGAALRPYNLPFEQVFEDRRVRVVDLDDDGLSEVVLIVADRNRGAAVALYAFDPGDDETSATVYPMAQSAFIGAPNRWLNPLDGAVDLDGDGSREIAVIETPHIAPTAAGAPVERRAARHPRPHPAGWLQQPRLWLFGDGGQPVLRGGCPRAGAGADPARRWWPGRGVYL